ncbi:MAG: 50S ribosomal protein L13 [bacterium]|nr:50S ribosomal protein L13 [bacterium]
MKTYTVKPGDVQRGWFVVDAADQILGRLTSQIAQVLRGKHKPLYSPHVDAGDFVVVLNADKVRLTGNKADQKTYFWHTGFPQGARTVTYRMAMAKNPAWVIQHAVKGMLPHNRLGRQMIKKLKIYNGSEHPHAAQRPAELRF